MRAADECGLNNFCKPQKPLRPHTPPTTGHPPAQGAQPGSLGFTLLELLVVLALIGLASSTVFPRLHRAYDSIQAQHQKQEILRQIAGLGYIARSQQQTFWLVSSDAPEFHTLPIDLPENWRIVVAEKIRIDPSGVCFGGALFLSSGSTREQYRLAPPFCLPEPSTTTNRPDSANAS